MNALAPTTAAPNWAEITTEPHCPLCEYMLRGLTMPRCPECGYQFAWAEVLEASTKRDHSYLFEHHPERNLWSFVRTMWGALWPQKFWVQLHPSQIGSFRRLLTYSVAQLAIFSAVLAVQPFIHICFDHWYSTFTGRPSSGFVHPKNFWWTHGPSPSLLDLLSQACTTSDTWRYYPLIWSTVFAWPLLTWLSLQLYDISMRRARIKRVHVLRCVLYSFDAVPACFMVFGATIGMFLEILKSYANSYWGYWRGNFSKEALPWLVVIFLMGGYRLGIAYWRYLRFQHVAVVVVSSQVITALLLAIVTIFVAYL